MNFCVFQLRNRNHPLEDHIVERLGWLKMARIMHIPKADRIPGADWRFLPNIEFDVGGGKHTNMM